MIKYIFLCFLISAGVLRTAGQGTADSRVCTCFNRPVPADFLHSSRALYGRIGLVITPEAIIKPMQGEPVKFILPVLESKTGCRTSYTLYVAGAAGQKIYESSGSANEISYTFPGCGETFAVTLMASSRTAAGGDGNCSRRLSFKVTPQCHTAACSCFMQKGNKGVSGDFGINGRVECLPSSGTQHRYVLRGDIVNKSVCVLNIQSVTVHGQTVEVPAYNTAPKQTTPGISLAFATPLTQSRPADNRLTMVVRYSLNGKKCTANLEIPYQTCQ